MFPNLLTGRFGFHFPTDGQFYLFYSWGWLGGWLGQTVIIGLISVQFQLNLPTGTELGNKQVSKSGGVVVSNITISI